MKILLLGATGRTGKLVMEEAIRKGYTVHCLVRNPQRIKARHERLKIFEGSPAKLPDLEEAVQSCEAIVSVLNISRTSDFPWSKLRTPRTFLSDVMQHIVQLVEKYPVKRVVICSAWGVSDTNKDIPGWFRWFIENSNIGVAYADHERQEDLLRNSDLSWTIVRPTGLTNSNKHQEIIESFDNVPKPKLTISRLSVATYMLDAINKDRLKSRAPVISAK